MQVNLRPCLELLRRHEGGYVDHPSDPGGCTNMGITIATFRRHIDPDGTCDDLRNLTWEQAADVYEESYWGSVRGNDLPPGVDVSVCDMGVNAGPGRGVRLLQRVVGSAQDGRIGPNTIAASWDMDGEAVIRGYARERKRYYSSLKTWPKFGRGWTRRLEETRDAALKLHREQRSDVGVG